jgi:hypothetical protein
MPPPSSEREGGERGRKTRIEAEKEGESGG